MIKVSDNIILAPTKDTGFSSISVFIKNDTKEGGVMEKHNTAHLLEHVLVAKLNFGVNVYAETTLDYTCFQTIQPTDDTVSSLKEMVTLIFNTKLDQENYSIQKDRILYENTHFHNHASYCGPYKELFGKDSLQYKVFSQSPEDILKIDFETVSKYRERNFKPKNAVFVIAGNFVQTEIENVVSELDIKTPLQTPAVASKRTTSKTVVWRTEKCDDIGQIDIFASAASLFEFKQHAADEIIMSCIAGGTRSLLDNLVQGKLGVTYNTEHTLLHWRNVGLMHFGYNTPLAVAEKTADTVDGFLTDLSAKITPEIFDFAKDFTLFKHESKTSDLFELAEWLGESLLLTGEIITPKEKRKLLEEQTLDSVRERVMEIFVSDKVLIKA